MTKVGHVKLNGYVVWKGGWCTNVPNPRGVNTLLIDPFSCLVLANRTFDTYWSSAAATRLSNYLNRLNHSRVIVGVSADEPSWNLFNALPALQQFGVEVDDVGYRGSFAFVAQKGNPAKTVLRKVLTESESKRASARLNATITGKPVLRSM